MLLYFVYYKLNFVMGKIFVFMCKISNLLMVMFFFILLSISCATKKNGEVCNWSQFYKDSVFLEFPAGDIMVLLHEGKVNTERFAQAMRRMQKTCRISGDTLKSGIGCGRDVGVSENMYQYFSRLTVRQNQMLLKGENVEIRFNVVDSVYLIVGKSVDEVFYKKINRLNR